MGGAPSAGVGVGGRGAIGLMNSEWLDSEGHLLEAAKPAVYLDASVLIDYWRVEGREFEKDASEGTLPRHESYRDVIEQLLRPEKRLGTMVEVRRKVIVSGPNVTLVTSPTAVLELIEWYASSAFTQMASEVADARKVGRFAKKEIGTLLAKAIEISDEERARGKNVDYSSAIEQFMGSTWPNAGFAQAHGLRGILVADIAGFQLSATEAWWGPCAHLAYLQLGAADITHVLFAHHLGCAYLAAFDGDFVTARPVLEDEFDLKLLASAEELLKAIS